MEDALPVEVDFDPALHSPARLKVMMVLAVTPAATFNSMAKVAALTPGNLATHLKALEAAGYVETYRTLVDLKPRARYRMTPEGREALKRYCRSVTQALSGLHDILAAPAPPPPAPGPAPAEADDAPEDAHAA